MGKLKYVIAKTKKKHLIRTEMHFVLTISNTTFQDKKAVTNC